MSVTKFELTRDELRMLADYWLGTYECLSDEDYEEHQGMIMGRIDEFEAAMNDLPDITITETPIEQLEAI